MRRLFSTLALAVSALLAVAGGASARESQLAGIKLGRSADLVTDRYGDPTRTFTGTLPTAGGPGGMPGMPGMEGAPSSAMPAPGMEGMSGMSGMPGMPGMPGMEGMPGMGGMTAAPVQRQKYAGLVAGMKAEEFAGRLLAPPAANPAMGGEMGAALAPGGMPGMPGMPGMEMGMPGMSAMPGMPGMAGPSQAAPAAPPAIVWVYERPKEGVTFVFGFSEEGRVTLVTVGDDKPYSTSKGGRHIPYTGAGTSKGIKLGSAFKQVITAYGHPESTEVIGDEVLLKYFERYGIAFTFRQNIMRVTSISIKSPDE